MARSSKGLGLGRSLTPDRSTKDSSSIIFPVHRPPCVTRDHPSPFRGEATKKQMQAFDVTTG